MSHWNLRDKKRVACNCVCVLMYVLISNKKVDFAMWASKS